MDVNNTQRDRVLEYAACRPEWWGQFVSDDKVDQAAAKLICRHCPVKQECLETYYLEQDVVVGGTTWAERLHALNCAEEPEAVGVHLTEILSKRGGTYQLDYMGLSGGLAMKLAGRYRNREAAA